MKRSILAIFIPNPFAFMRDVPLKPETKWEDTPKDDRKIDGYQLFLAERFREDQTSGGPVGG